MLFILLLSIAYATGCHPQCRWLCDDPVCHAVCKPICAPPVCQFNQTCPYSPSCSVRCPADQCENDQCPACETLCAPPPALECGEIECEAVECAWQCNKPIYCPYPRCELQCEHPACEYSAGNALRAGVFGMLVVLCALVF